MGKTNRFEEGWNGGTYICRNCKKLTRNTGEGERAHQLCRECNNYLTWQNVHNDDSHDYSPKYRAQGLAEHCPICEGVPDPAARQSKG